MSTTPQPLNDLVSRIRTAHPGAYDDMDDAELTKRVLRKYPQYSDLAAPKAAGPHITPEFTGDKVDRAAIAAGTSLVNQGEGLARQAFDPRVQDPNPLHAVTGLWQGVKGMFTDPYKRYSEGDEAGAAGEAIGNLAPLLIGGKELARRVPVGKIAGAAVEHLPGMRTVRTLGRIADTLAPKEEPTPTAAPIKPYRTTGPLLQSRGLAKIPLADMETPEALGGIGAKEPQPASPPTIRRGPGQIPPEAIRPRAFRPIAPAEPIPPREGLMLPGEAEQAPAAAPSIRRLPGEVAPEAVRPRAFRPMAPAEPIPPREGLQLPGQVNRPLQGQLEESLGAPKFTVKPRVKIKDQIPARQVTAGHVPAESSAIDSYRYDPEAKELSVKSKGGTTYTHGEVTQEEAQNFANADSKGKAWNEIRSNHVLVKKNGTPVKPRIAPEDLGPNVRQGPIPAMTRAEEAHKEITNLQQQLEQSVEQAKAKKAGPIAAPARDTRPIAAQGKGPLTDEQRAILKKQGFRDDYIEDVNRHRIENAKAPIAAPTAEKANPEFGKAAEEVAPGKQLSTDKEVSDAIGRAQEIAKEPKNVAAKPVPNREQELKSGISEGEQRLRSKVNSLGKRISNAELKGIQISVNKAKAELEGLGKGGEEIGRGETKQAEPAKAKERTDAEIWEDHFQAGVLEENKRLAKSNETASDYGRVLSGVSKVLEEKGLKPDPAFKAKHGASPYYWELGSRFHQPLASMHPRMSVKEIATEMDRTLPTKLANLDDRYGGPASNFDSLGSSKAMEESLKGKSASKYREPLGKTLEDAADRARVARRRADIVEALSGETENVTKTRAAADELEKQAAYLRKHAEEKIASVKTQEAIQLKKDRETLEQKADRLGPKVVEKLSADVPKQGKNFEGRYVKAALQKVKDDALGEWQKKIPEGKPLDDEAWDRAVKHNLGGITTNDLHPKQELFIKVPDDGSFLIPNTPKAIENAIKKSDRMAGPGVPKGKWWEPPKSRAWRMPEPKAADRLNYIEGLKKELKGYQGDLAELERAEEWQKDRANLEKMEDRTPEQEKQLQEMNNPNHYKNEGHQRALDKHNRAQLEESIRNTQESIRDLEEEGQSKAAD